MSAVLELVKNMPTASGPRSVLIVGSGPDRMPEWQSLGFTPTYLDIEPRNNPDIVASMTQMGEIGSYDLIFCCHALEHLYPHEVFLALSEFKRVLNRNGVAVILVPDLEGVEPNEDVLERPDGARISGLHLFYGDASQIAEFPYMAHHCGFVQETLERALKTAGFLWVKSERQANFNLLGIGIHA